MKVVVCILPCLFLSLVSPQSYDKTENNYYKDDKREGYAEKRDPEEYKYYYGGVFKGTCGNDGLYYMDASTFVFCSNGNAYYQPCAPGTRNSGENKYSPGFYYGYSEFCNINLVDFGFGSRYTGYVPRRPSAPEQDGYGKDSQPTTYDKEAKKKTYKYEYQL